MPVNEKTKKLVGVDESHWIPISDLMSVLMMLFLFIAVSYMHYISTEKNRIEEIAITYSKLQDELYKDLYTEFKDDLDEWNALIDKQTLSIKFLSPEILFNQGEARLKYKFKRILNDFFPRYISILTSGKYNGDIEEVRIEGHTSSEWKSGYNKQYSYFKNMELSQDRTRTVLHYIMQLNEVRDKNTWLRKKFTANGLSSSHLLYNDAGIEDKKLSRRVEFRVRTNAEKRIAKILVGK